MKMIQRLVFLFQRYTEGVFKQAAAEAYLRAISENDETS
jgi:hypothetical protein